MLAAPVARAALVPVHAVVLTDPRDGDGATPFARLVAELLTGSRGFVVVDPDLFEGRVGESPQTLFSRCGGAIDCWRGAAARGGVDQLVLVERVDAALVGIRVVDTTGAGDFRKDTAAVAADGVLDVRLLDRLFFRPGSLRIEGVPEDTVLLLDGRHRFEVPGALALDAVVAGKHTLELRARGRVALFSVVMVYPDQTTTIRPILSPEPRRPSVWTRWTTYFAAGVAVAGATGLAAGALVPAVAVDGP